MISGIAANGSKLANLEQYGFVSFWENLVCLWDKSGAQLGKLLEPQHQVKTIAFSPDARTLIIASNEVSLDGSTKTKSHDSPLTLRLWDLKSKTQLAQFKGRSRDVWSISFSPDGSKIAIAGDEGIRLWDANGQQIPGFKGGQGRVTQVAFNPDGTKIAAVNSTRFFNFDTKRLEGDVKVGFWDLTGRQAGQLKGDLSSVDNVLFSPDGSQLVTTGEDRVVRFWDLSGTQVGQLTGPSGTVIFSPDGRLLAGSGQDGIPRVWNLSGEQLFAFKGHQRDATGIIFSPDGKRLVTTGTDNTIRLWDLTGKAFFQSNGEHAISFGGFSFSPDGKTFATAEEDGSTRLWDLSGKELAEFKGPHRDWSSSSVTFSPDGKQLAITGADRLVRLWDIKRREV